MAMCVIAGREWKVIGRVDEGVSLTSYDAPGIFADDRTYANLPRQEVRGSLKLADVRWRGDLLDVVGGALPDSQDIALARRHFVPRHKRVWQYKTLRKGDRSNRHRRKLTPPSRTERVTTVFHDVVVDARPDTPNTSPEPSPVEVAFVAKSYEIGVDDGRR